MKPTGDPRAEIRKCGRCGEIAVVCVNAWKHSFNGVATNIVTRDCQCQSCGAKVTLHPRHRIIVLWVLGILGLPVLFMSLPVLLVARRRSRAWKQHPLVAGAPMPVMRYAIGPAPRRCKCEFPAAVVKATRHRMNGIPMGTSYNHRCSACDHAFEIENVGGLVSYVVSGILFGGIAVGLSMRDEATAASRWGWGLGLGALALIAFLMFGATIRKRFRHPELPAELAS